MSQKCNIFCPDHDDAHIMSVVRANTPAHSAIQLARHNDGSDVIEVITPGRSLRIHRTRYHEPGDKMSKMLLGACNFFYRISTEATANKQFILDHLAKCRMSIGFMGEPDFDEPSGHFDCIWALAQRCDGLVFNGERLFNGLGEVILDYEGNCDVRMEGDAATEGNPQQDASHGPGTAGAAPGQ